MIQDLIPILLQFYPPLAKWLCGDNLTTVETNILAAIQSVQGTTDPITVASVTAIANNPEQAANLKIQLAKISRDQEEIIWKENLNDIKSLLTSSNNTSQNSTSPNVGNVKTKILAVLSVLILLLFAGTLWYVLSHSNVGNFAAGMVGTLGTMTMTVIAYWFGSSLGSAQKSDTIHQLANNPIIISNQNPQGQNYGLRFIGHREVNNPLGSDANK